MPSIATWLREKDKPYFQPFFDRYPGIEIQNALHETFDIADADGLLLTGGSDIAPNFLRQDIPDPSVLDPDIDVARDKWEFDVIAQMIGRGGPIFAICKGMQVLNVALGGTLKLDIPGHRGAEMKDNDVQPLRYDRDAKHQYERVNSSHHQAVDRLADGFVVEGWSVADDIIEQVRLTDYPFALAVQYHPERGTIYDGLFEDFFSRLTKSS
jgi:putative glutamine amidotransferase